MIRTKSVYSPIEYRRDGFRLLITRFRGRGLRKNRYHVWMASLGPSEKLLRLYQAASIDWEEFADRYRAELFQDSTVDTHNRTIKNHGQKFTLRLLQQLARRGPVTLMCHCAEEEPHCHGHLLKAIVDHIH